MTKMENVQPKSPKEKTADFIQRVSKQMEEMGISEEQKKIIVELLKVEIQYPTYDVKDAIFRYSAIIRENVEG